MRRACALGALFVLVIAAAPAHAAGEGSISGTVKNAATGLPVVDVYVIVYNSNGVEVCGEWTTSAGAYSCSGLAAGSYFVRTSVWGTSASRGYIDELYSGVACPFESCPVTSGTPVPVTPGAATTGIDFSLAPGGRISGTVTDAATGLPLPTVGVSIYSATGSRVADGYTDSAGVYTSVGALPTGSFFARTGNSRGYFDEVYADISCPSGACSVTSGTPIGVTAGATTAGIDFALSPGGRVGGTVTDAVTGLPLADVAVGIFDWTGRSATSGTTDAAGHFTTDKGLRSGTYYARTANFAGYVDELHDDVPCTGGSCTVTRGAPIFVTAGKTTGIDFALRRGGRISGTVTFGSESPPYERSIRVRIYDASGSQVASTGETDDLGRYTSDSGLASGTYYAVAVAGSHVSELYRDIPCPAAECKVTDGTPIEVTAGATTTGIDFDLTPGGRISGTVTDGTTGLPLADVAVNVYDSRGSGVTGAVTGGSGAYTTPSYAGLATGTYYVRTSDAQGYLGELYDGVPCPHGYCTVTGGTPVGVTAGTTTTGIDLGLSRGGVISGSVTDAGTGMPLPGARVLIWDSSGPPQLTSAETDSSGVYTTTLPLPSGTYYVGAWSDGYIAELYRDVPCAGLRCAKTAGTPVSVAAGATTSGIDFALGTGGRISGIVKDAATGSPVRGVEVSIFDSAGGFVTSERTDASGLYATVAGLASGIHFARAYSELGYQNEVYADIPCPPSCTVTSGTPIGVTAGATTSGIDFGLGPLGRMGGTVRDAASGLPLAGVTVKVYRLTGSLTTLVTSATSDGSGAWLTGRSLPPGSYSARTSNSLGYIDEVFDDVSCPWYWCPVTGGRPISVGAGATVADIDFGLLRGGRIGGTVRDAATGLPLSYVNVRIHDASNRQVATTLTNALGVYATHGAPALPSGPYYVRTENSLGYVDELYGNIPCPGGGCLVTAGTPIRVTAGAITEGIDFGLARGGRIGASVADAATGLPLEGVEVSIHDGSGGRVTGGPTSSSGTFASYDALAPGTYYARTSNALGYTDELYDDTPCPGAACTVTTGSPIVVTAGAPAATIAFSLSAGGRISGAVTDAGTALPVAGVRVRVHDSAGRSVTSGATDASGAWTTIAALPSGTYYARTEIAPGYVDELYQDLPCPLGVCTVTSGAPIDVTAGVTTTGVNFALDPSPASSFYTLVPCRVLDTRDPDGPLGGPALAAGAERTFTLGGACGIPATAKAVSVNVTVTQPTHAGNVRLYPAGAPTPLASTVNYTPGVTRAGNATVPLNAAGQAAVLASPAGTVHLVLDVNGYYE